MSEGYLSGGIFPAGICPDTENRGDRGGGVGLMYRRDLFHANKNEPLV